MPSSSALRFRLRETGLRLLQSSPEPQDSTKQPKGQGTAERTQEAVQEPRAEGAKHSPSARRTSKHHAAARLTGRGKTRGFAQETKPGDMLSIPSGAASADSEQSQ